MVLTLGHDFDNEEMICPCGTSWSAHQEHPSICCKSRSRFKLKPKANATYLDGLRRLMGFSVPTIAAAAGVSSTTARRALVGLVGGRGKTSPKTAKRVQQVVKDMAGEGE